MKINNKGFTLVELLAVVVILATIAGIAVPNVLSSINSGKNASEKLMIDNIITASQSLYEEVEYGGGTLYEYGDTGESIGSINLTNSNFISINLQTLVSNGFLNGTNSCDDESGVCTKIILNPRTNKNIGECKIKIQKNTGTKVTYTITNQSTTNPICPTSYERGN